MMSKHVGLETGSVETCVFPLSRVRSILEAHGVYSDTGVLLRWCERGLVPYVVANRQIGRFKVGQRCCMISIDDAKELVAAKLRWESDRADEEVMAAYEAMLKEGAPVSS